MNISKIAVTGAEIAGGVAVGGAGAYAMDHAIHERDVSTNRRVTTETAQATSDWQTWKAAAQQDGGFDLPTPAAHQRFDAFLKAHPAPSWVHVQSDGYTRAHITADYPISKDTLPVEDGDGMGLVAPIGLTGGGVALAWAGVASHTMSAPLRLAALVGGGALAAFGAGTAPALVASSFGSLSVPAAPAKLQAAVNAYK